MPAGKDELKNQLQRKSLQEIELMMTDIKAKMGAEKNLTTLHRMTSDLAIMKEVHANKLRESGRLIGKAPKSGPKQDLKSFDDYVKSKK